MMVAHLIHSACLIYIVVEHAQWSVCVVHSDGMSSSSGGSSISSTKSVQIRGFWEDWRRSKGVDPCAKWTTADSWPLTADSWQGLHVVMFVPLIEHYCPRWVQVAIHIDVVGCPTQFESSLSGVWSGCLIDIENHVNSGVWGRAMKACK